MKNILEFPRGLNKDIVLKIAESKNEPNWMIDFRLKSLKWFEKLPMPQYGPNLNKLDLNNILYYINPIKNNSTEINALLSKLGIPFFNRKKLSGLNVQCESEVCYNKLQNKLSKLGVIFCDISIAMRKYPDLFKYYFGSIVKSNENKFAALNSAVWSGGVFLYIPENVKIEMPLQAYFKINKTGFGQFERTLIILEAKSSAHYIEGCGSSNCKGLHAGVVEVIAKEKSFIKYTTIQNWSSDLYNLSTKKAIALKKAKIYWLDINFGSKTTIKYPSIILKENEASGKIVSLASSKSNQFHDMGGKIIHKAKNNKSIILSKSIIREHSRINNRNTLKIERGASMSSSSMDCDILMMSDNAYANTCPVIDIKETNVEIRNESSINKINEDQIFYLMSKGLNKQEAINIIILNFADFCLKELPFEYELEVSRMLSMENKNV